MFDAISENSPLAEIADQPVWLTLMGRLSD